MADLPSLTLRSSRDEVYADGYSGPIAIVTGASRQSLDPNDWMPMEERHRLARLFSLSIRLARELQTAFAMLNANVPPPQAQLDQIAALLGEVEL